MRRRLVAGFMLFALVITVGLEVPLGFILQTRQLDSAHAFVSRAAGGLAVIVGDALGHGERLRAQDGATRYLHETGSDVGILVVSNGVDLFHLGTATPDELRVPAIARAAAGNGAGSRSGQASVAGTEVLYAVALGSTTPSHPGRAVVILSQPYSVVQDAINDEWLKLGAFGGAVLVAAALLGLLISASMIRPLRRIESAVTAIGDGELETRAPTDSGAAELRALGSAVNAMAARLDRLLQAQRSFAANASHQLRTPLTAMRLRLEQARSRVPPDSLRDIEAALDEVRRLSRIVNVLLELARAEATQPDRAEVDVAAVIADRIDAWRPLAEEQGLELLPEVRDDGRSGPLVGLARPSTFDQVLDNLLANAFEATDRGGSVSVEAHASGSFIEVHVLDTGRGLAPGQHELAFDRFWRADDTNPGGSGLGLAIVDHLLRVSGGSAELRARAGGGTVAIVRVPSATGSSAPRTPAAATHGQRRDRR